MVQQAPVRLITRGDDLGSFQEANLAIIDAYRNGILRNTSIMMPTFHVEHAVNLIKQEPGLCLGLHVTLTSEWEQPRWGPISPPESVASLLDSDGTFFRTTMELFERKPKLDEIMREVRAQLERARAYGLDIRYMDEHMGVGWIFEKTRDYRLSAALQELAQQEGLVFHTAIPHQNLTFDTIDTLTRTLQTLTPGTYLLVTHPAYSSDSMKQIGGVNDPVPGLVAQARDLDHQMLCDPGIKTLVDTGVIAAVRYDECI